jgi:hypothetical protein
MFILSLSGKKRWAKPLGSRWQQRSAHGSAHDAISLAGVMVVFAGLCALAIVFVWKFLPETKNLPVEEIVRVFEHQQTSMPEAA